MRVMVECITNVPDIVLNEIKHKFGESECILLKGEMLHVLCTARSRASALCKALELDKLFEKFYNTSSLKCVFPGDMIWEKKWDSRIRDEYPSVDMEVISQAPLDWSIYNVLDKADERLRRNLLESIKRNKWSVQEIESINVLGEEVITNIKVCCITNNPEQFRTEMEAVFGESKTFRWEVPKHETRVQVHLGFNLKGNYTAKELEQWIPLHCRRIFNLSINLI